MQAVPVMFPRPQNQKKNIAKLVRTEPSPTRGANHPRSEPLRHGSRHVVQLGGGHESHSHAHVAVGRNEFWQYLPFQSESRSKAASSITLVACQLVNQHVKSAADCLSSHQAPWRDSTAAPCCLGIQCWLGTSPLCAVEVHRKAGHR